VARIDVLMPQMGESIAEGTLSRWLKKLGDEVRRDEPIFEISTDKVDAEIPAPNAGVIAEILVKEGETVPVGALVARLETDASQAAVAGAQPSAPPAKERAAASGSARVSDSSRPATIRGTSGPPAPSVTQRGASPAPVGASSAPAGASGAGAGAKGNGTSFEERIRTKSSPLVRRMAAEAGVELGTLEGTGIAGRVTKRDFLAYMESAPSVRDAPRPARADASAEPVHVMPAPWPGDVVEPMSRIRQLTADHMVLARRTAMHVTTVFEVDLTRLSRVRAQRKAEFERETGEKLTYLPFIVRSVVAGLKQTPILNASVAGTDIIYRKSYNIGIAVALDWGLIVPVIKRADELSLVGLVRAINDLSNRARTKRLKPEEVQDLSFSITNHGVFGSLHATPIVPVPTTGILGVGVIEKRPKVLTGPDGEDVIAIRTCANFSLSFDHRVVDGADADRFMAFVKQQLESVSDAVS
jgi:pyruvate dehydrogenase E2 component (dihydrolipoamide acetyltransferase)